MQGAEISMPPRSIASLLEEEEESPPLASAHGSALPLACAHGGGEGEREEGRGEGKKGGGERRRGVRNT